jgi:hypothetical protein
LISSDLLHKTLPGLHFASFLLQQLLVRLWEFLQFASEIFNASHERIVSLLFFCRKESTPLLMARERERESQRTSALRVPESELEIRQTLNVECGEDSDGDQEELQRVHLAIIEEENQESGARGEVLQCLSPDSLLLHGVRLLLQHRGPLL